jgi:adenylate cyclase
MAFERQVFHSAQESNLRPMGRFGFGAYRSGDDRSLERVASALRVEVRRQIDEIGRLRRLKPYLSPPVAEIILKDEATLSRGHRREITVVFSDLRGFTEFSDASDPEAVLDLLKEYHAAMGKPVVKFDGTVAHLAGDGLMVVFNDPVLQEDHTERATRMALDMRECARELRDKWLQQNLNLDVGIGLATGWAALGNIGSGGRVAYTAVGNVTNLASRLCGAAQGGQILTDHRTAARVARRVHVEPVGPLHLKGFRNPVSGFNITRLAAA